MANLLSKVKQLFQEKEYVFDSHLSVDNCIERLKQSVDKDGFFNQFRDKEVIGRIEENEFSIRRKPGFFYRDSFRIYFNGRITSANDGSVISGHFFYSDGTVIQSAFFWLLTTAVLFSLLPIWFSVPISIMLFAWLSTRSHWSDKYVLNFLETTLEARPVEPKPNLEDEDKDINFRRLS